MDKFVTKEEYTPNTTNPRCPVCGDKLSWELVKNETSKNFGKKFVACDHPFNPDLHALSATTSGGKFFAFEDFYLRCYKRGTDASSNMKKRLREMSDDEKDMMRKQAKLQEANERGGKQTEGVAEELMDMIRVLQRDVKDLKAKVFGGAAHGEEEDSPTLPAEEE